ncbi:MAG: TetR/AcrR family transcriptional regulator [Betaproteobacteria bacterium]|nr:TetR/AcrR family transcriptional regulator [Betaproteobacteria bacterium]
MTSTAKARQEPRWERRKDDRPEQITAAALDLFVERGYAGTRLEDVAERAGVSKGTVYLYFANKTELFKAVVREGIVSPLTEARNVIDQYRGDMFELLCKMMREWWLRIGATSLSGIPKLVISEARNFPEIAEFYMTEVIEPANAAIGRLIERGIERGEFRAVDAVQMATLIQAPLLMLALWRNSLGCCRPQALDPAKLIDHHIEMLRGMLLGSAQRR